MPKCYQLIGVPGSGKSTWVANQDWTIPCAVISTDKWVEIYAKEVGRTYSEVFNDFMPTAVDCMVKEVELARSMNRDIIWDQTSTTRHTRAKKLRMLPSNYETIAVVFPTPDKKELARRLGSRPGKTIPDEIVNDMIERWEEPSESEGFDKIIHVR